MIAAVLAMFVFAGVWMVKSFRDDAYHLAHGPASDCVECGE